MPLRPTDGLPQAELALRLRAAIDTAIRYPYATNVDAATTLATEHPTALHSTHVRYNLGKRRWRWLREQGVLGSEE